MEKLRQTAAAAAYQSELGAETGNLAARAPTVRVDGRLRLLRTPERSAEEARHEIFGPVDVLVVLEPVLDYEKHSDVQRGQTEEQNE